VELFKTRGDIEAEIIAHSRAMEQAYAAANGELKEVLRGQLEDIEKGSEKLNAVQHWEEEPS
jgi:uncharacterized protein (DUF2225 family)